MPNADSGASALASLLDGSTAGELIFSRPVNGSLPWRDIEALFQEFGGDVSERVGSRPSGVLFGEVRVFHRPHPSPDTDKGAVASIRKWFEEHAVTP
jgi:hypothetical protein